MTRDADMIRGLVRDAADMRLTFGQQWQPKVEVTYAIPVESSDADRWAADAVRAVLERTLGSEAT